MKLPVFLFCFFLPLALISKDPPPRSLLVTRSMAHENLVPFLEEARPDIVQIGQYGAMFHGYADDPKSKGTPMQLPLTGEREVLNFQRELNEKIHDLGLKVVGHFRLVKAYGNVAEGTGFVDYYNNRWPEDLLGPKPHRDLMELLQRDGEGNPVGVSRYKQTQVAFCLSSPHARKMFKQMLKVAIDHGVDGVITTYNYHLECSCSHCQSGFREWLKTDAKFDEAKLAKVDFKNIPARISGYPDPDGSADIDYLAMQWAAENFKRNFDEIFLEYGRSLKPDLMVAQWNHIGHVGAGEERAFLPLEMWGRGEDYLWESGGASFVGKNLSLEERKAGDAWLSCLVLRELGGGKPFVMGKYDGIRMAASMAEGYATGGLGMGRYMRFEDPNGFATLSRYIRFRHEHERLFDTSDSAAKIALIMPRQSAIAGDPGPQDRFREMGQSLLEKQILFDVLADENIEAKRLDRYEIVILPKGSRLSDAQEAALATASADVIAEPNGKLMAQANPFQLHDAPWTVRTSAFRSGKSRFLHIVNYNRNEGETREEKGNRPGNERPIPVTGLQVSVSRDGQKPPKAVIFHSPEIEKPLSMFYSIGDNGELKFGVPDIEVYGIIEVVEDE
ncbi:MAG: hypothetical protein HKN23_16825 [Verrucomicrobiales bacterium]|nr:hypothetical protein [Verrucomicrobiales bacterium]